MLGRCRNPIGLLIGYGAMRGRFRDLRAGVHHGLVCLGCCWALMTLMVVFGMMNVIAMVAIAVVVALEKLWGEGERFARGVGVVAGVLAVLVLVFPGLAVGLTPDAMPMSM
jgi:predicted metal-binding membrane protein